MDGFNKKRETVKIDFFFITIKRFNTHILKNLIGKASNKFKKTIAQHRFSCQPPPACRGARRPENSYQSIGDDTG